MCANVKKKEAGGIFKNTEIETQGINLQNTKQARLVSKWDKGHPVLLLLLLQIIFFEYNGSSHEIVLQDASDPCVTDCRSVTRFPGVVLHFSLSLSYHFSICWSYFPFFKFSLGVSWVFFPYFNTCDLQKIQRDVWLCHTFHLPRTTVLIFRGYCKWHFPALACWLYHMGIKAKNVKLCSLFLFWSNVKPGSFFFKSCNEWIQFQFSILVT